MSDVWQSGQPSGDLKRARSRRLRKKLRIGEFQQLRLEYELTWALRPSLDEQEVFIVYLLNEVIAPRDLSLGGGVTRGFVSAHRGIPSEADRDAFAAWLRRWPGVVETSVGPIQDTWHDALG